MAAISWAFAINAGFSVAKGWGEYWDPCGSAGASLGNEGLATTARILTNVAQGAPVQEAARKETAEGAKNLLRKASKKYLDGSGKKRRLVGRTFIKRPRMDALGPY
ncbi:hypothetical protein M3Y99_01994000 [Aphelenchoides fujianensis]|nr:hypothetical protein M3Y99_01994000 [Aphelenchoides fujianensis]